MCTAVRSISGSARRSISQRQTDGVYLAQTVTANLTGRGDELHSDFGTGLVYSDNGNVADPASGKIVGTFNASGLAVPDSSLNRVFFLSQSQSQTSTNSFTLVSFDQTTYAQVSTIPLNNLAGAPFSMVRCGANGLAILTDINDGLGGMLYLIYVGSICRSGKCFSGRIAGAHRARHHRSDP
jgi:hypothetical protein